MGLSSGDTKKTMTFGWWEIIIVITITGVLASSFTLIFARYMKGKDALSGWEMRDALIEGAVMGSFYNNMCGENVWICGPDKTVSNIRTALQTRPYNSLPFLPRSRQSSGR